MIDTLARPGSRLRRPALMVVAMALLGSAAPVFAQSAGDGEARLRKVEAEVRALQRQVFPGSDGKFFTPEVTPGTTAPATVGAPATTPVSDLLTRMEAVEAQLSRLTAQNEETGNRVAQLEAKLAALTPAAPAATPMGLAEPVPSAPAPSLGVAAPASAERAATPSGAQPAALAKPAALARPAPAKPVAAKPSAQRLAAVQKIEKPQTGNAGDDEYSYGFRLWEAKFYPEAAQQLRLYVDRYPRDAKISYGRNLLGRAFLDDGKPRDAAPWFLKNYQTDKNGARAPDSLLNLADSMRQLGDTNRACIALAEFAETYAKDAAGRLKAQYGTVRSAAKCD